jgi:hypothetical protein
MRNASPQRLKPNSLPSIYVRAESPYPSAKPVPFSKTPRDVFQNMLTGRSETLDRMSLEALSFQTESQFPLWDPMASPETTSSTRWFCCLPTAASLLATASAGPIPMEVTVAGLSPCCTKNVHET